MWIVKQVQVFLALHNLLLIGLHIWIGTCKVHFRKCLGGEEAILKVGEQRISPRVHDMNAPVGGCLLIGDTILVKFYFVHLKLVTLLCSPAL